jgi:hypothetical protein
MSDNGSLVCGFADEATQIAGLAWSLPADSGGLIAREGATMPADAQVDDASESVKVELDAGELRCEVELAPRGALKALNRPEGEPEGGEPEAAICPANVNVSGGGPDASIECSGYLVRWAADPTTGAELLRQLAIPAADGSLILLASRRDPNGDGHASEATAAWLLDAKGGAAPFTEALLSTQYDGSGRQTRAGVELWPADPDAPPMRAAGTVGEGQLVERERVSAALLHTSAEGTEGLGGYVIWRADA